MTTLNLEGIEKFRDLRVSDLELTSKSITRRNILERLQLRENELTKNGYGLPYYLAFQYHIKGRIIKDLGEELGMSSLTLIRIFKDYEIPTLNHSEAKIRYLKEHGDPRIRSRRIRKKQKKFNNDEFSLTGQERKEIIKAYGDIAAYRPDFDGNWRAVLPEVSKTTGYTEDVVISCLEDLFERRD